MLLINHLIGWGRVRQYDDIYPVYCEMMNLLSLAISFCQPVGQVDETISN